MVNYDVYDIKYQKMGLAVLAIFVIESLAGTLFFTLMNLMRGIK